MDNTSNQNMTNCEQCPKHCPLTDLQCARGRYFHERGGASGYGEPEGDMPGCKAPFQGRPNQGAPNQGAPGQGMPGRGMAGHGRPGHSGPFRETPGEGRRGGRPFHGHEREPFRGHGRPREGMEGDDELSGLLGRCGHYLYHRPSRGRGQGRILKILASQDEMTQKELQEALAIQPGSASEIISKLEARGLLSRERDEEDKRRMVLKITDAGRAGAEAFSGEESGDGLYAALSEEEQSTLKELLNKLLESWSAQRR